MSNTAPCERTRCIWISWERHRRTRELCAVLDLRLFEFASSVPWGLRYLVLMARTLACLLRNRPDVLFIQCPSVVLGVYASALKHVLRYRLVTDLHNAAVQPASVSVPMYENMLRLIQRSTDLNIVTNDALRRLVAGSGVLVLPDRVPHIAEVPRGAGASGSIDIVFICSYASDEPYQAMFEAARFLDPTWTLHVTGDPRTIDPQLSGSLAPNVRLTGFLPHAEYDALLARADVVVDLTSREDCLVCGAYEAVAFEKPLVTSDTAALRAHFSLGTIFTRHDPPALAEAMRRVVEARTALGLEMRNLKARLTTEWDLQAAVLRGWLESGGPGRRPDPLPVISARTARPT